MVEVKARISAEETPYCTSCAGYVKPDIVFFGENLPLRFFELQESDTGACDCLICIGTSLEVYPFAGLADLVPPELTRILINRVVVGSFGRHSNDLVLDGDLVATLEELLETLNWSSDLKTLETEYKNSVISSLSRNKS